MKSGNEGHKQINLKSMIKKRKALKGHISERLRIIEDVENDISFFNQHSLVRQTDISEEELKDVYQKLQNGHNKDTEELQELQANIDYYEFETFYNKFIKEIVECYEMISRKDQKISKMLIEFDYEDLVIFSSNVSSWVQMKCHIDSYQKDLIKNHGFNTIHDSELIIKGLFKKYKKELMINDLFLDMATIFSYKKILHSMNGLDYTEAKGRLQNDKEYKWLYKKHIESAGFFHIGKYIL